MKEIMKRAWKIYRTLEGDRLAKLTMALRQAWAEYKSGCSEKQTFNGFAKVQYRAYSDNSTGDDCFLAFKAWSKNGINRIYINDYKRRTLGYIDCASKNATITNNQGLYSNEITNALAAFTANYAF